MGQAVAAHPAAEDTTRRGAAACPDDEQIARVGGDDGKNAAGIAALDHGLDRQISGSRSQAAASASRSRCQASSAQTRRRDMQGLRRLSGWYRGLIAAAPLATGVASGIECGSRAGVRCGPG
jgi:hypothetical protein